MIVHLLFEAATFLVPFLATAFLADLFGVTAFCGVTEAEPAWATTAAGAALFTVFLATLLPPFLEIFLDPVAFLVLVLLVTFFAPAGCALAINKLVVLKNKIAPLKTHAQKITTQNLKVE